MITSFCYEGIAMFQRKANILLKGSLLWNNSLEVLDYDQGFFY